MTDYTKITDFAAKDALPSGNPNKVARGTDVDNEYNAIQVSNNTKYDDSDISSQAQAEAGVDNTTVMTPLRTQQAIDAQPVGGDNWVNVVKPSDQSKTNDSTLAEDTDFTATLAAASKYLIEYWLIVDAGTTSPDLKIRFKYGAGGADFDIFSGIFQDPLDNEIDPILWNSQLPIVQLTTSQRLYRASIYLETVNSDDLVLEWAQFVSNAADVTVYAGSRLRYLDVT